MSKRAAFTIIAVLIIAACSLLITTPSAAALDAGLLPPVALFKASVDNVLIYENLTFDATASYDPNGENLTYHWDFDHTNDAEVEGSGKVIEHTYQVVGTYTVTLTVSNGWTFAKASKEIVVYAGSNRIYPVVAAINSSVPLNGSEVVVEPKTMILLDASRSYDPNSDPLTYEWSFSEGGSAEGEFTDHAYDEPGQYTVTLTVSTETGKIDSTTLSIRVEGAVDPGIDQPVKNDSKTIWAVFIIIGLILVVLVITGLISFLYISQRRQGAGEPDEADVDPRRSRFRSVQSGPGSTTRKKKKALRQPEQASTLKRKEKKLRSRIDQEKDELDKEMKSPFAGLKEILGGDKDKEPEEDDRHHRTTAASRQSSGGRPPVRKPSERRPPGKKPSERERPIRGPRKPGKQSEEETKKELDKETSKLESFLSDILASSPKEEEKKPDKRTSALSQRPVRALPPGKSSSSSRSSPSRSAPSRPSKPTRSSKPSKEMSDEEIKKELKAMEAQMEKEMNDLFKK